MKTLHIILTVLVVLATINGIIVFMQAIHFVPSEGHPISIISTFTGVFIGSFIFPAILFLARMYVGRRMEQVE